MAGKKRRFPVFWVCFGVCAVLLCIFWVWIIASVRKNLVIYEKSQPEYIIEDIVSSMKDGSAYDDMNFEQSGSRFEAADIYKSNYIASLEGKTLTYEKSPESYDAQKPVYKIYADDTLAAVVGLEAVSSKDIMFILSVQDWKVTGIEPVYATGQESVAVVVPDTYSVFLNDVKLDSRELTGNSWEIEDFQYAKEYTEVPKLVEYKVEGLFREPDIVIYNNMGEEVVFDADEEGNIHVDSFMAGEITPELEQQVLKNAKDYSNFFSKDIEGCRNSVEPIAGMFPENSYYLELAENYRLNDMWMYSAHEAPEFQNEKVSNYIMYTPQLFSVDIYFEKNMVLTLNGELRQDITNTRYFYAKTDDRWVIVDMQSVTK